MHIPKYLRKPCKLNLPRRGHEPTWIHLSNTTSSSRWQDKNYKFIMPIRTLHTKPTKFRYRMKNSIFTLKCTIFRYRKPPVCPKTNERPVVHSKTNNILIVCKWLANQWKMNMIKRATEAEAAEDPWLLRKPSVSRGLFSGIYSAFIQMLLSHAPKYTASRTLPVARRGKIFSLQ